jgi:hypothetical protein
MMELAREDPEHPYGGCGSVWRAAVRRERLRLLHEQAVTDVPIRFEGLPGEYLQVDWGEIRHFPFTQQTPVTRYFLACRLKYSRWTWVIFTDNMRQETLFRGLVACFNALGFVPWVLVFDNMKTVTTGRDDQQQPILVADRDYVNFLHPVRRLTEKVRRGARITRRYDTAQTPYRRVVASGALTNTAARELARRSAAVDPLRLKLELESAQRTLAERAVRPAVVHRLRSEAL